MLCWGYLSLVLNYFCSAFWIYHFYVLNILSKVLMFQNFNISGFCVTHYYYHYVYNMKYRQKITLVVY